MHAPTSNTLFNLIAGFVFLSSIAGGIIFCFPKIFYELTKLEIRILYSGTFIERWFNKLSYDRYVRLMRIFIIIYIGILFILFLVFYLNK